MKRTRVLIIDDNKSLVDMIKEYFSEHADIKISLGTIKRLAKWWWKDPYPE